MRRRITPARVAGTGLVLLGIAAAILFLSPSSEYIFLPDSPHAVAPLVTVPKSEQHPQGKGGVYFVDVIVRKASLLERLFPGLRKGSTLEPADNVVPCGVSTTQQRTEDLREMTRSQTIAAVVALRAAGYHVRSTDDGVLIDTVFCDSPAVGKLQPTQVLTAVDGKPVRTPPQLLAIMKTHKPGDVVHLTVRDGKTQKLVAVKTIADPRTPGRPVIGIGVERRLDADADHRPARRPRIGDRLHRHQLLRLAVAHREMDDVAGLVRLHDREQLWRRPHGLAVDRGEHWRSAGASHRRAVAEDRVDQDAVVGPAHVVARRPQGDDRGDRLRAGHLAQVLGSLLGGRDAAGDDVAGRLEGRSLRSPGIRRSSRLALRTITSTKYTPPLPCGCCSTFGTVTSGATAWGESGRKMYSEDGARKRIAAAIPSRTSPVPAIRAGVILRRTRAGPREAAVDRDLRRL